MNKITIRRAETPADYRALQVAQRSTWGIADDALILPIASMVAANHFGGLVLGAFLPTGEAAALSFAFLGRIRDRTVLYSQLTGVVPSHQSLGLGRRLKETQRAFCREQGIATIAWAFDPFQPGNARFNLNRLGATCGEFVEDMYGPRDDALNAGMPTDRLIAEWDVDVEGLRAIGLAEGEDPSLIVQASEADGEIHEVAADSRTLAIEIPASMSQLRQSDPGLADAWRGAVRRAFADTFARGYRARLFTNVATSPDGSLRNGYILER